MAMSDKSLVLVDLIWTRDKDPRVPLGHASLLSALKNISGLGLRSLVFPVNNNLTSDAIATRILDCARGRDPDRVDVAISAYVWGECLLTDILPSLRQGGFRGRIILGGPQITYCGPTLEEYYPEADIFIRGYAEDALRELVRPLGQFDIPGVHRSGSKDQLIQASVEMDRIPSPWLDEQIPLYNQAFIRWETKRGCLFKCSFCQHREPGSRSGTKMFPQERIEAEIDLFCKYDVREIAVLDPIFNIKDHGTRVLERFAANGYQGRLELQCRAEMVDNAFLSAAASLDVCLEFGIQTIHEVEYKAIDRPNNMASIEKILADVRERNIDHEVSLIFGLPNQTLSSFEESVQWCLDRHVPVIKAFPLLLLRGTKLDSERDKWGLMTDSSPMAMVIASEMFSQDQWEIMNRLSSALQHTEGQHPPDVSALYLQSEICDPDRSRWQSAVPSTLAADSHGAG